MESDIVKRLREWSDNAKEQDATDIVVGLHEAADEIERLRELSGDAGQLREERDDARREVCEWVAMMTRQKPSTAAKQRGWNCFKVKDVDEWKIERMREAINSLPSIPTCAEGKP